MFFVLMKKKRRRKLTILVYGNRKDEHHPTQITVNAMAVYRTTKFFNRLIPVTGRLGGFSPNGRIFSLYSPSITSPDASIGLEFIKMPIIHPDRVAYMKDLKLLMKDPVYVHRLIYSLFVKNITYVMERSVYAN